MESQAERELPRRLVTSSPTGYRNPERTTFAEFAERWFNDYLPARNLKATTFGTTAPRWNAT
jgi:hypothetical protein